jgi:hypothetical protein
VAAAGFIPLEKPAARASSPESGGKSRNTTGAREPPGVAQSGVTSHCQREVEWARRAKQGGGASEWRPLCVSGCGSLGRGLPVIALAALHLLQHDAVQEHGQFGGADLDAGRAVAGRSGEAKDPLFESLIPQAPAVLLPGEDLEPVAGPIAEREPVPGKGSVPRALRTRALRPSNDLRRSAGSAHKKIRLVGDRLSMRRPPARSGGREEWPGQSRAVCEGTARWRGQVRGAVVGRRARAVREQGGR